MHMQSSMHVIVYSSSTTSHPHYTILTSNSCMATWFSSSIAKASCTSFCRSSFCCLDEAAAAARLKNLGFSVAEEEAVLDLEVEVVEVVVVAAVVVADIDAIDSSLSRRCSKRLPATK